MFRDHDIQTQFEALGYVKLPWLSEAGARQLRALYAGLNIDAPEGFAHSIALSDPRVSLAVRLGILDAFDLSLQEIFHDVSVLQCGFITKTKGDGQSSYVEAHQDWTFVDESEGDVSISVWCPLEDTDHSNGNLCVVPRSHHLTRYQRPAHPARPPYREYYDLLQRVAAAVPTRLGEAILFDNALVHFSSANQTDSLRLVAGAMVIPASARPVLYYQNVEDDGILDEYRSGVEYFLQKPFGTRPDIFLRTVPKTRVPDAADEIRKLYPNLWIADETAGGGDEPPSSAARPHEPIPSLPNRLWSRLRARVARGRGGATT